MRCGCESSFRAPQQRRRARNASKVNTRRALTMPAQILGLQLRAAISILNGDDHLRDLDEFAVVVARHFLQALEGGGFVEAGALHEDAFGALDGLAVLERLPQVGGFLAERLKFLE